jgi:RNA polymerase sigma-70 factor, ECF subfamily
LAVYVGMNGQSAAGAMSLAAPADEQAARLTALFDAHHDRLYRLARRLVRDADEARDLVQETFLRAARSPGSVPGEREREVAWLVRVMVNIRRDQWRKMGVRARTSSLVPVGLQSPHPEPAWLARRTIWQALDRLSPRRRAVVVLHELEGLAASEIAALLGVSTITVRWHLSVGRRELARVLRTGLGDRR